MQTGDQKACLKDREGGRREGERDAHWLISSGGGDGGTTGAYSAVECMRTVRTHLAVRTPRPELYVGRYALQSLELTLIIS